MTRTTKISLLACAIGFTFACSGGDNAKPDAGRITTDLGDNASVPQTCQMCLGTSTGNECAAKGKICTSDSGCAALNKCVNSCANINLACIQNCGDAASQDAIDEWNNWADCTCGTCASQCGATFCGFGGSGGAGSGGSGGGTCIADNSSCSTTQPCCTFCASDNTCGCIPPGDGGCATNQDCCSNQCNTGTGECN